MSDETRQHPRSRRHLLKFGLASPLLLPLHAAQASAPIRVGQPSRPGSAPARASTPKTAASGRTAALDIRPVAALRAEDYGLTSIRAAVATLIREPTLLHP